MKADASWLFFIVRVMRMTNSTAPIVTMIMPMVTKCSGNEADALDEIQQALEAGPGSEITIGWTDGSSPVWHYWYQVSPYINVYFCKKCSRC